MAPPASFLHGTETLQRDNSPRNIATVKSAVIGLIGTAPIGPLNKPTLLLSEKDAAQFGNDKTTSGGFTIPQAINAIYDQGAGTIIVINVLDPTRHKTAIVAEAVTLTGDSGVLAKRNIVAGSVAVKNQAATTTHVENTDYVIDYAAGTITRKGAAIANNASLKIDYAYADPSKVTAVDIQGQIDSVTGARSGIKALNDCFNLFGFDAKILICPGYATKGATGVAPDLIAAAAKLGAMDIIDAPVGTKMTDVIAGRGPNGTIYFNTSSERTILCYPFVKVVDLTEPSGQRLEPLSPRLAGVMAAKDLSNGFWWSPSNTEIKGIVGLEVNLSAKIDDAQSDVNTLNSVGVVTVFNSFGSGLRVWGNRSAAFPNATSMTNFISVRRTQDMIDESIRYSSAQFVDMPLNKALIDSIVQSVNGYFTKLIGDGAILGGLAWYDASRNPNSETAAGHALISYKFTPPPPLERLTFESIVTGEYLITLGGSK